MPSTCTYAARTPTTTTTALAPKRSSYFHDDKAAREDRFVLERRGDRGFVTSRTMISIS